MPGEKCPSLALEIVGGMAGPALSPGPALSSVSRPLLNYPNSDTSTSFFNFKEKP